ncbi:hypothetical protein JCM9279_003811 [Rhodotorula babjevae]
MLESCPAEPTPARSLARTVHPHPHPPPSPSPAHASSSSSTSPAPPARPARPDSLQGSTRAPSKQQHGGCDRPPSSTPSPSATTEPATSSRSPFVPLQCDDIMTYIASVAAVGVTIFIWLALRRTSETVARPVRARTTFSSFTSTIRLVGVLLLCIYFDGKRDLVRQNASKAAAIAESTAECRGKYDRRGCSYIPYGSTRVFRDECAELRLCKEVRFVPRSTHPSAVLHYQAAKVVGGVADLVKIYKERLATGCDVA